MPKFKCSDTVWPVYEIEPWNESITNHTHIDRNWIVQAITWLFTEGQKIWRRGIDRPHGEKHQTLYVCWCNVGSTRPVMCTHQVTNAMVLCNKCILIAISGIWPWLAFQCYWILNLTYLLIAACGSTYNLTQRNPYPLLTEYQLVTFEFVQNKMKR